MLSPVGIRLSIMMFLQFFIWGSWYVTAHAFLSTVGFEPADKGWTYSVGPIAGMISPFFVGMIADRFFPSQIVMGVLHLMGGACMIGAANLMQGGADPDTINLLFFAHMLCYFPTLALSNSVAFQNIQDSEKEFPLIRVFGTIGWIIAGVALSQLNWDQADASGINMFYLSAGAAFVLGLYSFTLPNTPPGSKGEPASIREILGLDAFSLLRKPSYLTFMVCSFLICIPLQFYYQFANTFVTESGLSNPAQKMSFGQGSEIFFMIAMPLFFRVLGVKWMLGVGMLCWVIRYGLFGAAAGMEAGSNLLMVSVITGIVLHGICYDFFFVTGQIYTDKIAPKKLRSQAQGMLVLFTLGLGQFIGAQIGAQVESHVSATNIEMVEVDGEMVEKETQSIADWQTLWMIPCVMALAVLLAFIILFRDDTVPEETTDDEVATGGMSAHDEDEAPADHPPGAPFPDAPPA